MNSKLLLIIVLVVIVGGGIWWYVSGYTKSPADTSMDTTTKMEATKPGTPESTIPVSVTAVAMQGFQFTPANITVKKGATVTWTNKDLVAHTVTADNPSIINIASPELVKGETYSFTFNQTGQFTYHCTPHPAMTGTITVTE